MNTANAQPHYDFSCKVALVSGASSGIGLHTALALARAGARVCLGYFRNREGAETACREINDKEGDAIAVQADLRSLEGVQELFSRTTTELGPIDILVNNAGSLIKRSSLADLSEETWDEAFSLNIRSAFFLAQAVAPAMIERRTGSIINVASLAARNGGALGSIHYASAKAAMIAMTKGLAKELAPSGVRVNGVCPGIIDTPFHERFSTPEAINNFLALIPLGRLGTPGEVASLICFLASDGASYICGETVELNGGILML